MAEVVIVTALGRVLWNFLILEQTVTAILVDMGQRTRQELRLMEGGGKERALEKLRRDLGYRSVPFPVLEELDAAISNFAEARESYERAISAVHPFTVAVATDFKSPDELAVDRRKPEEVAAELRAIADRFESSANQLGRARRMLRSVS